MNRAVRIEHALRLAFDPEQIRVIDESGQHAGHGGYDAQGSHFRIFLISQKFAGKSRIARHRLVYDALASLLAHEIHALALDLRAPGEAAPPSKHPAAADPKHRGSA